MDKVFSEILADIKPDKKEIEECAVKFSEIAEYIKERFGLEALLMGSVAKDTFLRNDKDLDIFVFFPVKCSREELEKKGLKVGVGVFNHFKSKYEIKYAEHPYTKGIIDGFIVEIVPAYKLSNAKKLISAVDRTPFHTEFVLRMLKKNDEVRILKKFLKGIGCYGSDLKTEGFSGYLCELLIIKYGSFKNLIGKAQNFRYQELIDIVNGYSAKEKKKIIDMHVNEAFMFIDPVDPKRNVAAVLSKEKLARFIYFARKFEKRPAKSYFYRISRVVDQKDTLKEISKRGTKLAGVVFSRDNDIDDVFYPQLRRFEKRVVKLLQEEGFQIIEQVNFGGKHAGFVIELADNNLPRYKRVYGPRIFDSIESQDEFIIKHKKIWIEEDRFVAEAKRMNYDIKRFLAQFLDKTTVRLIESGVPKNIAKSISKHYEIVEGNEILKIDSVELWEKLAREYI